MHERTNTYDEAVSPSSANRPLASWYAQGLSDGLGDRLLMFDNSGAASLELLRFHPRLAEIPGFEAALREQVRRLGRFKHPAFSRIRSVQRLEPDDDLALVSNCPPGKRLSEVLHRAQGPAFASALIRQLAPALVLFQQHDDGNSHGLLNPDRIVVSPEGRLTIIEQVVGPAIDTLRLRTDQLTSMGIALPPAADDAGSRLGAATDWYQLGLVALSVLIGRPVSPSDLPQLDRLLDIVASSARADGSALSPFMRQWLDRALQISGARIESGADAQMAVEELVRKESRRDARPATALRPVEAAPVTAPTITPGEPAAPAPRTEPVIEHRTESASSSTLRLTPPPARVPDPAADSIEFFPREEGAGAARTREASIFEVRAATHTPAPTQPAEGRALFEQEALAGKHRLLDLANTAALRDHTAAQSGPQAETRRAISGTLVTALVLIVIVQAGVIAWLGRAQWLHRQQALVVETLASGEHVVVSNGTTVPAALRLSVAPDLRWTVVSSPSPDRVFGSKSIDKQPGTLQISSPIELQVLEGSRRLGSVPGGDLRLAPGRHEIELVNAALGFRILQTIEVEPGGSVSMHLAPPHGWVTIDATPWAEVSIDGQAVGRTPLGPLPLPLGDHVITFKHPAGSKDQQKINVKSDTTMRVVGNLRF